MRSCAPIAVSPLLALLIVAPAFASPQIRDSGDPNGAGVSYGLLPHAVIGEIQFAGLHRIPTEAPKSRLSVHPGEEFDSSRIAADVRALSGVGWFADVTAKDKESDVNPESAVGGRRLPLQFHVTEYPFLIAVAFTGSTILSQQQIKKLLDDKKLSPQLGAPVDPVRLHRVALAIQSELAMAGHPEAQALIKQEKLPGQRVKVEFQIRDGPRLPVVRVNFLGHPDVSDKVLRKQMRHLSPDAWFSGLRNKNVYTQEKCEEDRVNLLTYLQNHGFPQARIGAPKVAVVNAFSSPTARWHYRPVQPGLNIGLPVEAGFSFTFRPPGQTPPPPPASSMADNSAPISPGG